MDNNIVALLHNNLRVIIPEFGAFIIRQKQPRVIVFNEFLRYNDGLLIDFIVKNEGIDREVAEHQVAGVAEEWTKALNVGQGLVIQGLGKLQKDADGKIVFTEEGKTEDTVTPEAPVEKVTRVRKKVAAPPPAPAEQIQSDESVPAPDPVTAKIQEAAAPAEIEFIQEQVTEAIPEPAKETEPGMVLEGGTESGTFVPGEVLTFETSESEPAASVLPARSRAGQILFWVLLFLVVNALVIGWFLYGKGKPVPSETKQAVISSDSLFEQLADSVRAAAMDTQLVFEEPPAGEVSASTSPATKPVAAEKTSDAAKESEVLDKNVPAASTVSGSEFYIVLGSFRDEVNANTYVNSLKKRGYSPKIVVKSNGLFAVCLGAFENREKADTELKRIKDKFPEAWITRF